MTAAALKVFRDSFRAVEAGTEKRLNELPTFRGELAKIKDASFSPLVKVEDTTIDWETIHQQLPHHTLAINAVKKFYDARRDSILSAPNTIPPKVHQAVMEKLKEAEKMANYARVPLNRIAKELQERKESLEEKERFLIDEKINNILARNPEWAKAVADDLANLRYRDPQKGTHFQEE